MAHAARGAMPAAAAVVVNIYDVWGSPPLVVVNEMLHAIGTGAFHAAVEVFGKEWSYGFCESGTGVFSCAPRGCEAHHFRESEAMGETRLSEGEVADVIRELQKEWRGADYDLLRHNCCGFSNVMCERLGVGNLPSWVTNLAAAGATVEDGVIKATSVGQAAAIMAAARAGQIDERYLRGMVPAAASHFLTAAQGVMGKAGQLDVKHHLAEAAHQLSENARHAAAKAATEATRVATNVEHQIVLEAQALDQRCHIRKRLKRLCPCGSALATAPGRRPAALPFADDAGVPELAT